MLSFFTAGWFVVRHLAKRWRCGRVTTAARRLLVLSILAATSSMAGGDILTVTHVHTTAHDLSAKSKHTSCPAGTPSSSQPPRHRPVREAHDAHGVRTLCHDTRGEHIVSNRWPEKMWRPESWNF